MADPRTFVLIGDFQDNITPALEGINNSIAGLKRTMSTMTTKNGGGFSDVTQSVGKLVSAQIHLKKAIEEVGAAAKEATGELKEYRNAVGKVASAHYHIAKSSQQAGNKVAQGWNTAVQGIEEYGRKQTQLANATKRTRIGTPATYARSPGGGGGGASMSIPPVSTPRGFRGGGYDGGNFNDGFAKFTLSFGLSEAIAAPITGAIAAGFQIGVGMMMKPFEYFMNGMQERMQDEMSDLKAASGFFSINKMSEKKFLERGTFQEAIDFMQKNNALMAKLAGSLPGSTQDFIEVNKRISDSIAQLVTNAPERAMVLAEKIRSQETSTAYSSIGPITGPPTAQGMQNAMQILMADLTKQTVLAGQGTGSGTASSMGAYGLPQLTERMLSQQDISMAQMQRYAAIFRDPMIMRNLERELPKISATMANTPERYEALRVFFEKVLPPELVERYRRTLMGVQETFNTAIFSPETGIFGLGRKMKQLGGAYDEFGRMLDKTGKVTKDVTEQMRIDIDIYGLFRDIVANVGRVLAPIAENLSAFWDPLLNIGKQLEKARVATMEVLRSFEIYNKSFGQFAKTLSKQDLQKFGQTGGKELRASLATIANLLRQFGILSEQDFQSTFDKLLKVDMDGGKIFKELLDKFLQSDVAKQIGEFIGTLIGTILSEISQVTGFLSGRIKGMGQLFEGIKEGFNAAGGPAAFGNIFKDIFGMLFRGLVEVAKMLPLEAYIVAGLMATLPIAIQTLSMVIANKITEGVFGANLGRMPGGEGLLDRARQTYLLDKAKAQTGFAPGGKGSGAKNAFATTADDLAKTAKGEDFIPLSKAKVTTISQDIAEMTAKIIPEEVIKSKDFPNVALGTYKPVEIGGQYSTTDMFRRMPKPPKQEKGLEWLKNFIVGSDDYAGAPKAKDLGKNLRIAGEELAEGFSKKLEKGKNFFKNFYKEGGLGTRMGAGGLAGLKNPLGMMDKFGVALIGLTGILSGVSRFFETGDIFKAMGATAGPIIGNILGFAIAGPLGSFIAGWIFSQEAITDRLGEIFQQLFNSIASVSESLSGMAGDFLLFVQSLTGATTEAQALQQALTAINVILFPLTATFDLLAVAAALMRIAMLEVYMFVDKWFKGGTKQKELAEQYDEANRSLNRLIAANDEKYARLSRLKGETSVLNGKKVVWSGKEWIDPNTNKPPAAQPKPDNVTPTVLKRNYTVGGVTYDWKTGKPVSGTTPSTPAATPPKPSPIFKPQQTTPVAATLPAPTQTNQQTQQLLTDAKQTATQVAQLNTKAATQVTQGTSIQKSTDETKKNTTTANTTLGNIKAGIMTISNKLTGIQNAMLGDLNNIQAGVASISSLLSSGSLKVKAEGMGPGSGPLGTAKGDLGRAQNMASQYGLSMTSWFRAGDKGYHGLGRAMDFSNGISTPQQMEFAQAMVNQYGTSLKELIYTPLGFGIKDGTRVPLSYWGAATNLDHYDHVHVAFAGGPDDGRMFKTRDAAGGWENSMVPGSVKVASITGNSAEGFGTTIQGGINVTVNAGNISDPDILADVVAQRILSEMQSDSIFV